LWIDFGKGKAVESYSALKPMGGRLVSQIQGLVGYEVAGDSRRDQRSASAFEPPRSLLILLVSVQRVFFSWR
jgi:hypothetical protein